VEPDLQLESGLHLEQRLHLEQGIHLVERLHLEQIGSLVEHELLVRVRRATGVHCPLGAEPVT